MSPFGRSPERKELDSELHDLSKVFMKVGAGVSPPDVLTNALDTSGPKIRRLVVSVGRTDGPKEVEKALKGARNYIQGSNHNKGGYGAGEDFMKLVGGILS